MYCRTTISVAAGAVAAAMAPRVRAAAAEISWGFQKWMASSTTSTRAVVRTAWRIPMTMAARPICRSCATRNSLPMAKAMKPRAAWEMTL